MALEPRVVLEPPERCLREREEVGASRAELLEMGDRVIAVGGIEAGEGAVRALREMTADAAFELGQALVAAAHDEHVRSGRDRPPDRGAGALDRGALPRARAPRARLP